MGPSKVVAAVAAAALATLVAVTAVEAASTAAAAAAPVAADVGDVAATLTGTPAARTFGDDHDDDGYGGYCKWFKYCNKYYERSYEPCAFEHGDRMAVAARPAGYGGYTYGGHEDPRHGGGGGYYKFVEKHGGRYKYWNKHHGYKWFGKHHGHGVWWKGGHGGGYGYHDKKAYYCKEHDGYTYCKFRWGHGYKKTYYCAKYKCFYKKKCFY